MLLHNSHLKFGRSDLRGYILMDINPKEILTHFYGAR